MKKMKIILISLAIIVVIFFSLVILGTVLSGCNGGSCDMYPKTAFGEIYMSLKSMSPSSSGTSNSFSLQPGEGLVSTQFKDRTGLDSNSVLFCVSNNSFDSITKSKFEVVSTGISSIKWTGDAPLKTKALVSCEINGKDVGLSISFLNLENCSPSSYCGSASPCCAVIFEKAK